MAAPAEVPQPVERLFQVYKTRFPADHPQHREAMDGLAEVVGYIQSVVYSSDPQAEIPPPVILEEDPFGFADRGQLTIVRRAFDRQRRAEASGVSLRTPEATSPIAFRQPDVRQEKKKTERKPAETKSKPSRSGRTRRNSGIVTTRRVTDTEPYVPPSGFLSAVDIAVAKGVTRMTANRRYGGLPSSFVRGGVMYINEADADKADFERNTPKVPTAAVAVSTKKEPEWISEYGIKRTYNIDGATIIYLRLGEKVPTKEVMWGEKKSTRYDAQAVAKEMRDFREPPRIDRETGTLTDPMGGVWATARHARRLLGGAVTSFSMLDTDSVTSMPVIDLNGEVSWAMNMAELRAQAEPVKARQRSYTNWRTMDPAERQDRILAQAREHAARGGRLLPGRFRHIVEEYFEGGRQGLQEALALEAK